MYLKVLNIGLIVPDSGVEQLSINNLPTVVRVSCSRGIALSYDILGQSVIDTFNHNIFPVQHMQQLNQL